MKNNILLNRYLIIEPDSFIEIQPDYNLDYEKNKYKNRYRKLLYFLLNEGFRPTWKKSRSVRLEK
ncbi:MAG: hypothetical protein JSU92_08855, partial [Deltaproteobacteria bacterium]